VRQSPALMAASANKAAKMRKCFVIVVFFD
jgi:hypothetical protein